MKHISLLVGLFLLVSVAACREELPQINPPEQYRKGSLSQEFEAFWNGMNNNYLFWYIDPTDWNEVYRIYKPLFAQLNVYEEDDQQQAYTYYQEMTAQLVDSHYSLIPVDDDVSQISPALSRVRKRPDFHNPIPTAHYQQTVFKNYLNQNGLVGFSQDSSAVLVAGKLKNTNTLYFRIPKFDVKNWYTQENRSAKAVIQYVFDELQKSGLDGIILDVRGNPGGNTADLNFLIGRLTDKPYVYGANRAKGGMGRLDYLPWVEASVYPPTGAKAFGKPVVVLADMFSVSMSEATVMAVKALPAGNGKIVGERTWGGMGAVTDNASFNGGQFSSTMLIKTVYCSSMMFRYKDGKIYEGIGFPPDVDAKYDGQALQNGRDTQLEAAMAQIK